MMKKTIDILLISMLMIIAIATVVRYSKTYNDSNVWLKKYYGG